MTLDDTLKREGFRKAFGSMPSVSQALAEFRQKYDENNVEHTVLKNPENGGYDVYVKESVPGVVYVSGSPLPNNFELLDKPVAINYWWEMEGRR